MRRRLDVELVRRGLARSREQAQELIDAGRVSANGVVATKSASQVEDTASVVVRDGTEGPDYVSRGARKLEGALAGFPDLQVAGRRALDAGASTGGFTEMLLLRGALQVLAVDVGYGQLDWRMRTDDRVIVMERTNVRDLVPAALPYRPSLVVADLSFISLALVLPALILVSEPDADLLLMVKPQFEVGKDRVGAGGVVRDPALRADAVRKIAHVAYQQGFGTRGVVASPLPGPRGNVEYFLWLRAGDSPLVESTLSTAIAEGPQ